jgi:alkylhydroperoxidase family enzyme
VHAEVTRLVALVALSPPRDARVNALIRGTCARTLSLPPLPAEGAVVGPASEAAVVGPAAEAEKVVAGFAEQFSLDVSAITEEQRGQFVSAVGRDAFRIVVLMYVADFVPRVRAGLEALGLGWVDGVVEWDHTSDPSDVVFNEFLPGVARMRALDPVTSEIVRLRGATQHNCRLCKSLREGGALDAGGSETLYGDIERYETSFLLSGRQKAALRYVDALIWSPARISGEVAEGVRRHFSEDEAVELTLDVMRNASNKIAVALGGDAPRVQHGTERYVTDADGQPVFAT